MDETQIPSFSEKLGISKYQNSRFIKALPGWAGILLMAHQLIAENMPLAAGAALVIVGLLAWRLKPVAFRVLSWQAVGIASALFWGLLAALLISYTWGFYYSFFAPAWYRFAAPLGALIIYATLGLTLRWAAIRLGESRSLRLDSSIQFRS